MLKFQLHVSDTERTSLILCAFSIMEQYFKMWNLTADHHFHLLILTSQPLPRLKSIYSSI
jgi:hypothetical protein